MKTSSASFIELTIVFALASCSAHATGMTASSSSAAIACPTATCPVLSEVPVEGGVACSVNGVVGAMQWAAGIAEVVKAHQPEPADLALLNKIKRFVHSKNLRYGYVGNQFMVFDADKGACGNAYYNLLNVPCNAYQPEENKIAGGGVDGCLHPRKFAWLRQ